MRKRIDLRITEEERLRLIIKADSAGYGGNISAYIRKMALDGLNVRVSLDMSGIREIGSLISNATNNINQIAKKANETNSIHENDVKQLRKEVVEIRGRLAEIEVDMDKRLKQQSNKIIKLIQDNGF